MRNIGMFGWLACAVGLAYGCGSTSPTYSMTDGGVVADGSGSDAVEGATLMIASGMRFATASLTVPAGTAIAVRNEDSLPHTVTSESAPNAFAPSGVFDTGTIAAGGTATITIPASAASGTVYYYYCSIHKSGMVPAHGMIMVQ